MRPRRLRRAGSRYELLRVLCNGPRTAGQLAAQLGISSPAVRKTLAGLHLERLVSYRRVIRGVGKPAHEFAITPDGEAVLSHAYLPMLSALLSALDHRLDRQVIERVLRDAGKRLSRDRTPARLSARHRAAIGAEILNQLGASAAVARIDGQAGIACTCCAIGAVVTAQPLACKAIEELLSETLGTRVVERCDRAERPRCRFVIS